MHQVSLIATSVLALALNATPALAECQVDLQLPAQGRFTGEDNNGYNSYALANLSSHLTVVVSNESNTDACTALLSAQRPAGRQALTGDSTTSLLAYELRESQTGSNILDTETLAGRPPHALAITLEAGRQIEKHFSFYIPPRQNVASGSYADTILFRVFDSATLDLLAEKSTELQTRVQPQASIFVSDTGISARSARQAVGQAVDVDFGKIQSNQSRNIGLTILSNDGYSVRFESNNNGALYHQTEGGAAKIDYSAFFRGEQLQLSGGQDTLSGFTPTQFSGSSSQLRIVIGDISKARAGRYDDQMIVTVLPDS